MDFMFGGYLVDGLCNRRTVFRSRSRSAPSFTDRSNAVCGYFAAGSRFRSVCRFCKVSFQHDCGPNAPVDVGATCLPTKCSGDDREFRDHD